MKHKIQDSSFKIYALCFVAVIALAFLFVPTAEVYAQQVCSTSVPCFISTESCYGLGQACSPVPATNTCPSGVCLSSGTCEGVCQPLMPSAGGTPFTHTIDPPTGATSFSAIVCNVLDFFSKTILPPLAVLMMLVVGFLFMMGGQIPQKAVVAKKTLLYVTAGVVLLLLAPGILGIVVDITGASSASFTACSTPITTESIIKTITGLVNWFAWFVSVFSVAMGLYAGALYLTARGDSSQVLKATKVFSFTIIGIAVAVVSFSIIILTKTFFGI